MYFYIIFFLFFPLSAISKPNAELIKCMGGHTYVAADSFSTIFKLEEEQVFKVQLIRDGWSSLPAAQFPSEKGFCFNVSKPRTKAANLKSPAEKEQCGREANFESTTQEIVVSQQIKRLKDYFEVMIGTIDPWLKDRKKRKQLTVEIAASRGRLESCRKIKPMVQETESTALVAEDFASQIQKRIAENGIKGH